jgi:metal-dependent amidase/aminoacylase/carboxypeptidase family protein
VLLLPQRLLLRFRHHLKRLIAVGEAADTHGAMPWLGVDPIVVNAQIVVAV